MSFGFGELIALTLILVVVLLLGWVAMGRWGATERGRHNPLL